MGKGRAPTALENYLLNKHDDTVYSLPSMEERAENYSAIYGVSVEEAAERIRYNDTHQHESE